jgi:hypothetical protein
MTTNYRAVTAVNSISDLNPGGEFVALAGRDPGWVDELS